MSEEVAGATVATHYALHAMQSKLAVAATGQPGMGKTSTSMMCAIQMLFHQKAALLYVRYKWDVVALSLP